VTPSTLPRELETWSRSLLGRCEVLSEHGHTHAQARVWRLQAGDGICFLKSHLKPHKWEREVFSYHQWRPAYGAEAPRLIGMLEGEPRAILTTALPGCAMDRLALTPAQERRAWQAAGRRLASLHRAYSGPFFGSVRRDGSPLGEETQDPAHHFRTEIETWIKRGTDAGRLLPAELELARQAASQADVFEAERPVACHGDYTPRNWIVSEDGRWVGAIDFEHARWDVRTRDLSRWWDRELVGRPDLEEAFLNGYCPEAPRLAERQRAQIRVLRVLFAMGAVIWGGEVGDDAFAEWGHSALERIRAGCWHLPSLDDSVIRGSADPSGPGGYECPEC
jgi:Ser/Thr protein kinase RdoA (MazF antagonist)